jgi:hypothetical protein
MRLSFHRLRLPVLTVLGLAWMVASNHCAIAALAGGHPEPSCCKKEKTTDSSACAEKCCGGLAAPVPVADVVHSPGFPLLATLPDLPDAIMRVVALEFHSGLAPPGRGGSFFVEFVVSGSHQPMAPPAFVA